MNAQAGLCVVRPWQGAGGSSGLTPHSVLRDRSWRDVGTTCGSGDRAQVRPCKALPAHCTITLAPRKDLYMTKFIATLSENGK